MAIVSLFPARGHLSFIFCIFRILNLFIVLFCFNGLAKPIEDVGEPLQLDSEIGGSRQITMGEHDLRLSPQSDGQYPLPGKPGSSKDTLKTMLDALDVMQSEYFVLWQGTWPTGIDWTKAVIGTHVSATLSALTLRLDSIIGPSSPAAAGGCDSPGSGPSDALAYENLIDHYFQHTSAFWFGEDFLALRFQAYDDMLWVVLEWLENLKFQDLHDELHYSSYSNQSLRSGWHGKQFKFPAAHRARIFHELAARGWDTELCDGGMIWSPYLTPYKNAITNELFISASIGMYIYFPGDQIDIPIASKEPSQGFVSQPRNPAHLDAAVRAYEWLKDSNMLGVNRLYADGFHIRGWSPDDPGTGECDVLNTMIYTYNQGVILSGLRGLWLSTGSEDYLKDGHELMKNVMKSTGWPDKLSQRWQGLGRGGVLEDVCDSSGGCSQNGHTFKGIFFHHLAEFCRPLTPFEERFLSASLRNNESDSELDDRKRTFKWHQKECSSYRSWIKHNANAAYMTKNDEGKFGMWWGRKYPDYTPLAAAPIPPGATDYRNTDSTFSGSDFEPNKPFYQGADGAPQGGIHDETPPQDENIGNDDIDSERLPRDVNDRGRGRTLETQASALAVFRALYHWETAPSLKEESYE